MINWPTARLLSYERWGTNDIVLWLLLF